MTFSLPGIARRLDDLERRIRAPLQTMVEFATLARTRGDGFDQVNVEGEGQEKQQRPVRRLAPWGVAGVPVVGVLAGMAKAIAGAFGGMVFGIATDKYGPQDLAEGETSLYCKAGGTRVYLDKEGNIFIDAAAGKDITINGGTKKVGRVDDTLTSSTTLAAWAAAVETAISSLGGAVAPPFSPTNTAPGALGKIATGAPHVIA